MTMSKSRSHGRIGEAATAAKCWMHGISAYSTAGLQSNFAGADLIVDTEDPGRKLLVEVKTGYDLPGDWVYLTQNSGERWLTTDRFSADFVVFVNLARKLSSHTHSGELDFQHLTFYVASRDAANRLYRDAILREAGKPKRDGGERSLNNLLLKAPRSAMDMYRDAWSQIRDMAKRAI